MRKQNWEIGGRYMRPQDLIISSLINSENDLQNLSGSVSLNRPINTVEPIVITSSATLDLANNSISNSEDIWAEDKWSVISVDGGTLTIEGKGTIKAKENDCYAIDVKNGGKLIINDGTFIGNVSSIYVTEGEVIINGGRFEIQQLSELGDYRYLLNCLDESYKSGKASIKVLGGEFVNFNPANNTSEGLDTNYIAEGYKVIENNGVFKVVEKEDKKFLEQLSAGGNIELSNPINLTDAAIINNVTTINLNNQIIKGGLFAESNGLAIEGNSDSYVFWVKDGGNLTIEGKGEIIAQDATYSMAVWANGGIVNIKDGIFKNGGDSCDLIYASAGGKVYIYGGEFIAAGPASGNAPGTANPYVALNVKDADYKSGASEIKVYGGKFYGFNPANNLSEGKNTNFVAKGYKSIEIEPNIWEVVKE